MPSTAPPPRRQALDRRSPAKQPTAALPPGALERRMGHREVSAVPPTSTATERTSGVANALVTEDRPSPEPARENLIRRSVIVARIVALAGGVALTLAFDLRPVTLPPLALGIALTLLRSTRPARTGLEQGLDVVVVAAMLAMSGGMGGPFALFGAATAFSIGVAAGIPGGLAAAGVLVLSGGYFGIEQLLTDARDQIELGTLIPWISLYPVGAVLGGLVRHVLVDSRTSQALLVEANRVLASLERLAVAAPEALSPARVAAAGAAQFRQLLDADIVLVLFEREGTLLELGRDGTFDAGPHLVIDGDWAHLVRGNAPQRLDESNLPARVARQLPALPRWLAIPLRSRDSRVGVALVGGEQVNDIRPLRTALLETAAETALAMDNTQLFSRIEHAAAAAERERLASDLHDGVAQQLTHVRFELELLAREAQDEATRDELGRLARVAVRASDDVRSAIRGLRAQALDEGLVPALHSLVTDLDSATGPDLELVIGGAAELDADTTAELYRIVQEALSNALRHAAASTITVAMDVIEGTLVLTVEDDGRGLDGDGSPDGDGLGLRTMRQRARRIGASFSLDEADEGGVRATLRLPLAQEPT